MLYYIEDKTYILVNSKYRQITVSKKKNEFTINLVPNSKIIEYNSMYNYPQISVETAYKILKK